MSDMRAKYAILGVSIVAMAGIIGAISFASAISTYQISDVASTMTGHVTVSVADEFGNIKSYEQTDNLVTLEGRDCAIENLFGTIGATNICPTSVQTGTYDKIALGSNPAIVALADTKATPVQVAIATATGKVQTTVGPSQPITMTHTFTAVAGAPSALILRGGDTVAETMLYDGGTGGATDNMLARKDLSSVTVTTGDTVTITWLVTVT